MKAVLQAIKTSIRKVMRLLAVGLNAFSHGKITPSGITIFGLLMHVPIAFLIGTQHNLWAALLLLVFGLFDTLDGELARLQKRESERGGLLDAATDRMKETLIYSGAAFAFAQTTHPTYAFWAAMACGASICVSYVKAKGEAIVAAKKQKIPYTTLNKMFADGIFSFEIRMFVVLVGLVTNQLVIAVALNAVCSTWTAFGRLSRISKQLD